MMFSWFESAVNEASSQRLTGIVHGSFQLDASSGNSLSEVVRQDLGAERRKMNNRANFALCVQIAPFVVSLSHSERFEVDFYFTQGFVG